MRHVYQVVHGSLRSDKSAVRKQGIDILAAALRSQAPEQASRSAAPYICCLAYCAHCALCCIDITSESSALPLIHASAIPCHPCWFPFWPGWLVCHRGWHDSFHIYQCYLLHYFSMWSRPADIRISRATAVHRCMTSFLVQACTTRMPQYGHARSPAWHPLQRSFGAPRSAHAAELPLTGSKRWCLPWQTGAHPA